MGEIELIDADSPLDTTARSPVSSKNIRGWQYIHVDITGERAES